MGPKEILSRLTGISCPIFGISWNPPEAEVAVAKRMLAFFEDQRVLYNSSQIENQDHCIASVMEIRRFIRDELGKLSKNDGIAVQFRAMRAACHRFLDQRQTIPSDAVDSTFFIILGELRSRIGIHIGVIAVMHNLSVESTLEGILPPKQVDPSA